VYIDGPKFAPRQAFGNQKFSTLMPKVSTGHRNIQAIINPSLASKGSTIEHISQPMIGMMG